MTTLQNHPNGYIILTGTAEWDEVAYASYCLELGAVSCGDTIEQALDNLDESIAVLLEDLADIGTLDKELAEKGIAVKTGAKPADTVIASVPIGKTVRVYIHQIPAPVLAAV